MNEEILPSDGKHPVQERPSWASTGTMMGLFLALAAWGWMVWMEGPSIVAGDSGETVSAAVSLGISHPPGHPLGELLGRLALGMSIGTAAFRINLLSALATLLASGLLGNWTARRLQATGEWSSRAVVGLGTATALVLAFNPLVLEQSLSAKGSIYTLSLLWWVCLLRTIPLEGEISDKDLIAAFFWEGLAFATHWPTAAAGAAFLAVWIFMRGRWNLRAWFLAILAGLSGLSVYLLIPLRAIGNPPLDWGHPVHWESFKWLITRANYNEMEGTARSWGASMRQLLEVGKTLVFSFPWSVLGVGGLVFWGRRNRNSTWPYLAAVGVPLIAVGVIPTLTRDTYFLIDSYLTAFQGLWVFLAMTGLAALGNILSRKGWPGRFLFIVLALTGTVFFGRAIPGKNVSRDLIPYDLGVNVLQGLPRQAVILAEGDTYVLSLLHAQMTEGLRPDVAVVPTVFLNGDWGFRQAWAAIRLSDSPGYIPTNFAERVSALVALGAPLVGKAQRNVFVSTGDGAFLKAGVSPEILLEPWGLSFFLTRTEDSPLEIRDHIWRIAQRQRLRGMFDGRKEVKRDPRKRELYGYYANQFILSGNALQVIGLYQEAADDYAKALRILPVSAEAYSNLAAVAGATGRHELAYGFCRLALEADPDYAGAWDNMGNVYSLEGRWDDALDAYDRALELKPDSPATRMNRDRAEKSQKEGKIGTVQHHDVQGYMEMGIDFYKQQRWVMAEGVFETVREMGSDGASVMNDLGVVRAQLGDAEGSRKAFEEAMQKDPKFQEAYKNYGLLLIQEGKKNLAREILEKGKAIDPTNPQINELLASLDAS